MSSENLQVTEGAPRMERWLRVMLFAFVPLVAAFFVGTAYRLPFFIAGGVLAGVGFLLLIVQERRR
jgi:hypothetical protein